jgi:nitrate/TMAO reductase-like tetraheme cytochrome c subunit
LTDRRDEWDAVPAEPEPVRYRRFDRARSLVRPPSSGRGVLVLVALVGGIGTLVAIGGMAAQKWTESAAFCTRCHTMAPEAKAYKLSIHRDVACGECHVGPGLGGFVKAKLNGARQTIEMITGSFPKPIPPPDHAVLPSPKDTCMKCHSLGEIASGGNPTKIILRPRYLEDKSNTREMVAVVVRPLGLEDGRGGRGAHWHVEQQVEFTSPDETAQKIDWVGVTYKNGTKKQFIARPQVGVSSDVRPDISRLMRTETTRPMDCITCHNRVGHELPSPDQAIDDSIAAGRISQSLPYIKRVGVSRLGKSYRSAGEADRAIDGIRGVYAAKYPLVAKTRRREVDRAVKELKLIYGLVATPEMKAIAADYPSNLGHQSSPGCFRCHDGAHYQVGPKGRVLDETIPWACTTCHTFPQVGRTVTRVPLAGGPAEQESKLWVDHDKILYRHPQAIAKAGLQTCAYCHQEVFCARCHKNPVLEPDKPYVHREADLLNGGRGE